ncbi:NAD(P)/FAD-dependent oxidoreductase [Olivibacter ginsenosidimutans]
MQKDNYDAVIVGSGPNGLAAAIALQQEGLDVLLLEGKETIGGGLRSAELLLPGYKHDICSAIHPLALQSPFFKTLPLAEHGLQYCYPEIQAAHPLDDGRAVGLYASITATAEQFGVDKQTYLEVFDPLLNIWPQIIDDVLAPFHWPKHPMDFLQFGWKALRPAMATARQFQSTTLRALWAGMAAHAMLPLSKITTSAIALVLTAAGHQRGWPIPKGGSQGLAQALAAYFVAIGGEIVTNYPISSLSQLPKAKAVLFDLGPKQLLQLAGHRFSATYRRQLQNYRYGMGVFKMDWILDGPVPFTSDICRKAGTVHIGNTLEEIAAAEAAVWNGRHPEKPFVLLAQQSLFDESRTQAPHQVVWAYCHVPNGSHVDMTAAIEGQIARFAPGFRERIIAKCATNAKDYETYNPNYVGGDINGGVMDIGQLFTRPALRWSPYRTSAKGIYICSSATPPGGGVHGMCGYYAAKQVLADVFKMKPQFM